MKTAPCTRRLGALAALVLAALAPGLAAAEFMDVNDYDWSAGGFEAAPDSGLRWTSPDENWRARVGGRLHLDFTRFDDDVTNLGNGEFDVRRARLFFDLRAFEDWRVKVDGELSDEKGRRGWRNVFLQYGGFERLRLRLGNFIAPISLEENTSSNDITFMERSLMNAFTPSFQTGLSALYSGKQRWTVHAGVFFQPLGDRDDDRRRADGVSFVARGTWVPWGDRDRKRFIHLGGSIEYRNLNDRFRIRTRPESGSAERLISTDTLRDADDVVTFGLEAAAVWGPFSIQGEYIRTNLFRSEDVAFDGGYVQLSWFPTGENRRYTVKRGTFLSMRPRSRWGALELAARYSAIDLTDRDVIGGDEQNVTLGVNWYLTRYVRVMFNYVIVDARLEDTEQADRPHIAQWRIQFAI